MSPPAINVSCFIAFLLYNTSDASIPVARSSFSISSNLPISIILSLGYHPDGNLVLKTLKNRKKPVMGTKTFRKQNFWRSFSMSIEEMRDVDIRTVDPETLVDVTKIMVDAGLPKEKRVAEFLRQVKNPYCFRVGDMVVKNVYSDTGVSLRERFAQFAGTL